MKVTLIITALLEEYFSRSSSFYSGDVQCQTTLPCLSFYVSTSLPLSGSVSVSPYLALLFADSALLGFLMRCHHLKWDGGGVR